MTASYTFLPWVRQGAASAIRTPDPLNDTLDSRVRVAVAVRLKDSAATYESEVKVRLYGPGDVTGFDDRQIIRTDPKHLTPDFEPNYFPVVEFDCPDFPWLFTPAAANSREQLRPWICLVVVEKRSDNLKANISRPLPILTANAPTELPDLSESWAWAHAQVLGNASTSEELGSLLADKPERNLSRLLCPCKLEHNKSYYACVVPTFEVGRKAGLGEPVDDLDKLDDHGAPIHVPLKPAWDRATTTIELPVYYHWEFSTGTADDFESLVWLLQRRALSANEVGLRQMNVINPDPQGDPQSNPPRSPWPEIGALPLEGALRPVGNGQAAIVTPQAFKDALQKLLNISEGQQSAPNLPPGMPVAPPIYGRWHAAQRMIPDGNHDSAWLRDLNLNPSHRVAASIGTQIVQDQQEQLMASAWDQLGEIEKANQVLRQAQLARSANQAIYRQRLSPLSPESFIYITNAVHPRLKATDPAKTLYAQVRDSRLPQAALQGAFRRLTRPRGPLARRTREAIRTGELLRKFNERELEVLPPRLMPQGLLTMDRVFKELGGSSGQEKFCSTTRHRVRTQLASLLDSTEAMLATLNNQILEQLDVVLRSQKLPDPVRDLLLDAQKLLRTARDLLRSDNDDAFLEAIQAMVRSRGLILEAIRLYGAGPLTSQLLSIRDSLQTLIGSPSNLKGRQVLLALALSEQQRGIEPCDSAAPQPKPQLPLAAIKVALLPKLDPGHSLQKRIQARLVPPPDWKPEDPLEPIMAAPNFPTPMYKPLAELSQDFILPGLEHIPPNTITGLETNPRFIEAYMVGLNHEMSRELLWREFPTDQRGTYFRQFWDLRGRVSTSTPQQDIEPISEWKNALGSNLIGDSSTSQLVLLIRGDLLKRYPRAIIYAAKAKWVQSKDGQGNTVWLREPAELIVDPKTDLPQNEAYPIFRGTLSPDITFLGFDIKPEVAKGQPGTGKSGEEGYFFVIQQPSTEPRYGLDESAATSDPSRWTWRDLSWAHVKTTLPSDNGLIKGYIQLAGGLDSSFVAHRDPTHPDPDGITSSSWSVNSTSAALAYITLQGPFRVAIHASDLL